MTSKEYLSQIYNLDHKIYLMQLEVDEYRRLADSVPGPNYDKPFINNPNPNTEAPFMKWLTKALDKEREIEKEIERLNNLKIEVLEVIDKLDNLEYRMLLKFRYLQALSFGEISKKMYASPSSIKRWHNEALELIVVPEKYVNL